MPVAGVVAIAGSRILSERHVTRKPLPELCSEESHLESDYNVMYMGKMQKHSTIFFELSFFIYAICDRSCDRLKMERNTPK
jgi:hypothetical protein